MRIKTGDSRWQSDRLNPSNGNLLPTLLSASVLGGHHKSHGRAWTSELGSHPIIQVGDCRWQSDRLSPSTAVFCQLCVRHPSMGGSKGWDGMVAGSWVLSLSAAVDCGPVRASAFYRFRLEDGASGGCCVVTHRPINNPE